MSHYGISNQSRPTATSHIPTVNIADVWDLTPTPTPPPPPTNSPAPSDPPADNRMHIAFGGRVITLKETILNQQPLGEGQSARPNKLVHSEVEGQKHLVGQKGANNVILGLSGQQYMYSGTTEAEGGKSIFGFSSAADSSPDNPDSINNFVVGKDKIDVSNLTPAGKSKLDFVQEFSGQPGQAMIIHRPGEMSPHLGTSYLLVDTDGDGNADFKLKIQHARITEADVTS